VSKKKVVVVGAGPGGLTAGMLLASRGYDVEIFEKEPCVGGRNARLSLGEFHFDLGPTFLMMRFILDEVFQLAGREAKDYLEIKRLDPLYRLKFGSGRELLVTSDSAEMKRRIEELYPGDGAGMDKYLAYEPEKYRRLVPCLQVPYDSPLDYLRPKVLQAVPYLDVHLSLYQHLGRYFKHEETKLSFTFQAKYLGMSPWKCPGLFSLISFIEHDGGIHHPIGGLNRISVAMAKVVEEERGRIHLSTPVREVIVRDGKAVGVRLESGDEVRADHVVVNADFGHAVHHLFPRQHLKRWTPEKLERKSFSCSTFMLYLGVDKVYRELSHHNIFFAPDYKRNVDEISERLELSQDPSVYVQNACVTDPTLAPEGQSTLYVLVPIANNRSNIPWASVQQSYREKVLDILETRAGLSDVREHIVAERVITPLEWESPRAVYRGAVFNLGHNVSQMLYLRPHNRFEEIDGCYLVGGGTHPGSGLPTIYESGRISAGLIMKRDAWL